MNLIGFLKKKIHHPETGDLCIHIQKGGLGDARWAPTSYNSTYRGYNPS